MGVPTPSVAKGKKEPKAVSETRKVRKPLMEKKRRDRINSCLTSLASLILGSSEANSKQKPDQSLSAKVNRLEKADILEQTVQHWHKFLSNTKEEFKTNDGTSEKKEPDSSFLVGYKACLSAVDGIMEEMIKQGENVHFKTDLNKHLCKQLNKLSPPSSGNSLAISVKSNDATRVEIKKLTSKPLQFLATKLQDGQFALVMKSPEDEEHVTPTRIEDKEVPLQIPDGEPVNNANLDPGNSADEVWRPW